MTTHDYDSSMPAGEINRYRYLRVDTDNEDAIDCHMRLKAHDPKGRPDRYKAWGDDVTDEVAALRAELAYRICPTCSAQALGSTGQPCPVDGCDGTIIRTTAEGAQAIAATWERAIDLRAENESLRKRDSELWAEAQRKIDTLKQQRRELRAERDEARGMASVYLAEAERDRYRAALKRIAGNGHVLGWSVAAGWASDALNGGTDD